MDAESPKPPEVRFAAMNFLAMREHSVKELKEKLGRKYPAWPSLVATVVQELSAQNLQSDERFATAFIAMRQRQGKGSQLIRLELRERGISAELIASCLDDSDSLWQTLARAARHKRFGAATPTEQHERARQMRFLQARGFAGHHIQQAFSSADDDYF